MTVKKASVSVIIPCYRSFTHIRRTVESVMNQTMLPEELFLVDDFSNDNDATLTELYKLRDEFSHLCNIEVIPLRVNKGPSKSRNIGWDKTTAQYVAFLDADDAWHHDKLQIQYEWMLIHKEYDLSCHAYTVNNNWDTPVNYKKNSVSYYNVTFNSLIFQNYFSTPNVMLRREISIRFPENKRYGEDYFLWLQILSSGCKAGFLNVKLTTLFKEPFGESGLSSELWMMEKGELDTYWQLLKLKKLSLLKYLLVSIYSILKYIRRTALINIKNIKCGKPIN